jgi:hypothetical protein
MKLLEIIGSYGKVAYFEKMNKDIDRNSREKLWNLSWQVADKLRLIDDYQYLDEILKVLFLINYKNAYDRFYELKKLIDKIGKDINPNYYHKTIKISDDNMDFIIKKPNFISTAPGDFY